MNKWLRRSALAGGVLVAVPVLALGGIYGMSASAVGTGHESVVHAIDPSTGDAIEGRGSRRFTVARIVTRRTSAATC